MARVFDWLEPEGLCEGYHDVLDGSGVPFDGKYEAYDAIMTTLKLKESLS